MEETKVTLVINAIINKENMSDVGTYMSKIMPVFAENGAVPVGKYSTTESLVGDQSPELIALFNFDSAQKIKDLVNGEAFVDLSELRARAFSKINMMICSNS